MTKLSKTERDRFAELLEACKQIVRALGDRPDAISAFLARELRKAIANAKGGKTL